jgi:hypothetical protein
MYFSCGLGMAARALEIARRQGQGRRAGSRATLALDKRRASSSNARETNRCGNGSAARKKTSRKQRANFDLPGRCGRCARCLQEGERRQDPRVRQARASASAAMALASRGSCNEGRRRRCRPRPLAKRGAKPWGRTSALQGPHRDLTGTSRGASQGASQGPHGGPHTGLRSAAFDGRACEGRRGIGAYGGSWAPTPARDYSVQRGPGALPSK